MSDGEPSEDGLTASELLIRRAAIRAEAEQAPAPAPPAPPEPGTPRHAAPPATTVPSDGEDPPVAHRTDSVATSREIFELLGMADTHAGTHSAARAVTAPPDVPATATTPPAAIPTHTPTHTPTHVSAVAPVAPPRSPETTPRSPAVPRASTPTVNSRTRHPTVPPVVTAPAGPLGAGLPGAGTTTDVVFAPREGARRVVGLLLLLGVTATVGTAYVAYDDPRPFRLSVTGTLLLVTLVLYGVRASSSPSRLAIRSGQLEVVRGSTREVFDLTSRYARVEVVGTPGRRGWKVLFGRFGRAPFVVDASMVDAAAFTVALQQHRPRD